MNILTLVYKNLTKNKARSLLTIIAVAIGVLVLSTVIMITTALSEDIIAQSETTDLIIGGQGSPTQLLLSTKFHYELPPGNISYNLFEELKKDQRVAKATPLALGDNYQGNRIIGTDYTYFVSEKDMASDYLAGGRFFQDSGEAVIGSKVANELDLKLGAKFQGDHGIIADGHAHQHDFTYEVVGILKSGLGSDDNVIFTDIESVWEAHHIHAKHFDFYDERRLTTGDYEIEINGHDDHDDHDDHEHHDDHDDHEIHDHDYVSDQLELTAIFVEASDVVALNQLQAELNDSWPVQAIVTSEVARDLLEIIGEATTIINILVATTLLLSLLAIILALLNSALERREEIAIMRLLGSSKKKTLLMVFLEGISIVLLGMIIGVIGSYLISYWISLELESLAGLSLDLIATLPTQLLSLAVVLLLGIIIALIPAIKSYFNEVTEYVD